MTVCAQSSQRATWPPSATVRQRSIALMTFSWSRLTCPALARRRRPVVAEYIRDLQRRTEHGRGPLRRRLVFPAFLGLLARLGQQVERAFDAGDHAGGNARVTRRGVQFVVTQQRLDDADIGAALEQMGREAVAERVQRHALLDPGRVGRLMEQAAQLAGGHRLAGLAARKQPTFFHGRSSIVSRWAHLPPLAQQIERFGRQHDMAILAALGLLDANDLLRLVDMFDLQPDHFARAQAAAIAETKQHADLEAAGDGEQTPRLVRAHHQRNLLGLTDVIDLGCKIQSPQRHAEQEPQPGHDAVAVADAHTRLSQVQLEPADILGHSRIERPLEKRSKPPATADVALLRSRTELARVHVLDHALAQWADGIRTHRKLLSWMRLTTPRSSRQGTKSAIDDLSSGYRACDHAARFSGLSRSDLVL